MEKYPSTQELLAGKYTIIKILRSSKAKGRGVKYKEDVSDYYYCTIAKGIFEIWVTT